MDCIETSESIEYLWHYSTTFLILSPYVWERNGLLNQNYWDDFDIIDQGHSKDNFSQFFLYLGNLWTNFNKISTTMMESWPATKKVLSSDLDNVDQVHHLQKSLYLRYYTNDFYQTFIEMKARSSFINMDSIIFYCMIL